MGNNGGFVVVANTDLSPSVEAGNNVGLEAVANPRWILAERTVV